MQLQLSSISISISMCVCVCGMERGKAGRLRQLDLVSRLTAVNALQINELAVKLVDPVIK